MEHLPELASVVRQVLGDDAAEPSTWTVAPVGYARMRGSTDILRVGGEARVPTGTRPFSAILKHVARPLRNGEPAPLACRPHCHSWRRELLAARSGLFDDPPGIRAPRCYAAVEEPDGSFRLWHEEVVEEHVGPWPIARYVSAARALGRFNGAYLVERPPPADDWLVLGRIGPPGGRVGSPGVSLALAAEAETTPDPAAWIGQTWSRTVHEALAQWPHAAAQLLEVLSEP